VLFLDVGFWVVRLTISGSAQTIRVVKTVVGFLQLMCFSFWVLRKGVEKNTGKTTPIQNTHQTTPIIYEFMTLNKSYIHIKGHLGRPKRIEC
jgi:hypothetical protein